MVRYVTVSSDQFLIENDLFLKLLPLKKYMPWDCPHLCSDGSVWTVVGESKHSPQGMLQGR